MNQAHVDRIVAAVLYEGYILYPYRPSSVKNRQRFTFGRVYPRPYERAQNGREPAEMQTQCLMEISNGPLHITVRFLHPLSKQVGSLSEPVEELPQDPAYEVVPGLAAGGRVYHGSQEAVERTVSVHVASLLEVPLVHPFEFAGIDVLEPVHDEGGFVAGLLHRRQPDIRGTVVVFAERVDERVGRITVKVTNETPVPDELLHNEGEVLLRTFASTHTLLHAPGGNFLSLMDPPKAHAEAARGCRNRHTWPVLVGESDERDTLLSSPIILYDYPKIAPESAGNLFDGTEIDEILTLRIRTLAEDEVREIEGAEPFAQEVLGRTMMLSREDVLRMHGIGRTTPTAPSAEVVRDGVRYAAGDRVRIHPKRRADAMDLALAGRTAVIESIETDFEDRVHLALVLDDDPGKDLGHLRQSGHRFFYDLDEVRHLGAQS